MGTLYIESKGKEMWRQLRGGTYEIRCVSRRRQMTRLRIERKEFLVKSNVLIALFDIVIYHSWS